MKKTLLVLGASGLTGSKIIKNASDFEVFGTYNSRIIENPDCSTMKLDVVDKDLAGKIFSEIKPDVVINTTASHNVDYCEENKAESDEVNTKAVKTLFDNCEKYGSKLIHFSTDFVFDGNSHKPYSETDTPNPINYYAKTKLEGEKLLLGNLHVVLRPSVVTVGLH